MLKKARKEIEYSLWLMPSGDVYNRLANLKVRLIRKKDVKQARRVVSICLRELLPKKDLGSFPDVINFKKEYLDKGGIFLVAELNRRVIGTAAIIPEGKSAKLYRMYLLKKFRGKGIGSALYNRIEKWCKNKKFKEMVFATFRNFTEAIKFYLSKGFKQFKKTKELLFFKKKL